MSDFDNTTWEEMEEEDKYKALYIGKTGITPDCLFAIDAILNSGSLPEKATIISTPPYSRNGQEHLFLFWDWWHFPLVIVPSGFKDGYSGGGATGFSLAICLIRSKKIPIYWLPIERREFTLIDSGNILEIEHPLFKKIQVESDILTWPWPLWVSDEDEELLKKEQIWRKCYWREPKTDWLTETIGDVELINPDVGKKLRLARDKTRTGTEVEDWQNSAMLIRDAWIELSQWLCNVHNVDTSDIPPDSVIDRLKKLKLDKSDERLFNLSRASFNLSMKHHKRDIDLDTAVACVISTIVSMKTVIKEALHAHS